MYKKINLILVTIITALFILCPIADSQAFEAEVTMDIAETDKLVIDYHKDDLYLSLSMGNKKIEVESGCPVIDLAGKRVELAENLAFTENGIEWNDKIIPYNLLKRIQTETISRGHIKMDFKIRKKPSRSRVPATVHSAFETLVIDADRFIRGDVISVVGDVEIYGEVSKSVISLFGDVSLHTNAVVRGDVIAICGRVYRHDDSQIYGQLISQKGREKGGRKYGSRSDYYHEFTLGATMDYNRVDGFHPKFTLKYTDPNYFFPNVNLAFSYAFELKRLRYQASISQRFFDKYAFEPYGSMYKETASDDDWICTKNENLPYTFIVNEDFRDYYEREGGSVGVMFYLGRQHTLDLEYRYDRLDKLTAQPLLWSLFGKKEFRSNFSSLPYDLKQTYASDFVSKLSQIKLTYTFDSRFSKYNTRSGWIGHAYYEKAGGQLGGDLDYERWWVSLTRYQPLNKQLGLKFRMIYAGSENRLPLFKKYFLGGLQTLRGYDHKQFYGEQMILGQTEYIVDFSAHFSGILFFDIGKVAGQDDDIFSDGEFKSNIGLAIEMDPGLRFEIARALDNSDPDIKIWVTFSKPF